MARKRAPGGGRKPKGSAPMRSQLTIRIPDDTRDQLEASARRNKKTLSDELLWRLRNSFGRERDERRDPAMRGLCFLIAELAHHVVGLHGTHGISRFPAFDWRSDAFFYRALKVAVTRLLDELEPPGPIEAPEITVAKEIELDSHTKRYIDSFKKPETRAELAIDFILTALRSAPSYVTDEEFKRLEAAYPSRAYPFYGIADAARALDIKRRSGRTELVTFKLKYSLSGEPTPITMRVPAEELEKIEQLETGDDK